MSDQVSKKELVKLVAEATNSSQASSEEFHNAFIDVLRDSLKNKKKITIQGFGTFKVSERPARKGRNPRTGEEITIEAKTVVKFTTGVKLSEAVN
jgi:DNA-binding protein HU-beta